MKPCPFCGNENPRIAKIKSSNSRNRGAVLGVYVVCEPDYKPCGAQGPIRDSIKAAKIAWGKRK